MKELNLIAQFLLPSFFNLQFLNKLVGEQGKGLTSLVHPSVHQHSTSIPPSLQSEIRSKISSDVPVCCTAILLIGQHTDP